MKNIRTLILVIIGILLIPNNAIACGMKNNKLACKTAISTASCKMKCCQKNTKNKSNNGCEGKCGKSTCQVQLQFFGAIFQNFSELKNNDCFISTSKQSYFNQETTVSDGFYFIWSPPNIG